MWRGHALHLTVLSTAVQCSVLAEPGLQSSLPHVAIVATILQMQCAAAEF